MIDDSADNQDLLKTLLVAKGYEVNCSSNGRDALSLLKELSQLPDLILLDAQMPVMDGYQFRIEQNKIERLKDIPVIVMSGDNHNGLYEEMNHPQGILLKPLNIRSLIENVSHF